MSFGLETCQRCAEWAGEWVGKILDAQETEQEWRCGTLVIGGGGAKRNASGFLWSLVNWLPIDGIVVVG